MKKVSAKRATTRGATVAPIRTLRELADLIGRDVGTASRWVRRVDWPYRKRAPWSRDLVPKILRWAADNLKTGAPVKDEPTGGENPDDIVALRKEKLRKEIRKLHAQADAAETALARERGQLLDAAEVEADWAAAGARIRNGFQNLASQILPLALSHGMPHEASTKFQQQVTEAVNGILRYLSRDEAEDNTGGDTEAVPEPLPA